MSAEQTAELSLRDYWRVIVRRKWVIVVALLATVIPALALAVMQEPIYQSQAQMLINSRPTGGVFGNAQQTNVNPDRIVQNEIRVLEGQVVRQRLRSKFGIDQEIPPVSGMSIGATDVVAVRVRSGNAESAANLANAYTQAYIETKRDLALDNMLSAATEVQAKITEFQTRIDQLTTQIAAAPTDTSLTAQRQALLTQQAVFRQRLDQMQVDSALTTGNAQIVQAATVSSVPVEPTPARTAALAIAVGLLLGLGAAFLIDYLDDAIRTRSDVAKVAGDRPVLAVVPIDPPPDLRPVSLSQPHDLAVEEYRALRTNVQFLGFDRDLKALMVTSSIAGEGKSTTAANLAVMLAQAGNSVVLVDADLRKPRIREMFGLVEGRGLTDNLLGTPLSETIVPFDEHLHLVRAGAVPPNPSEMLSGRRMKAIVTELRAKFEYVLFDTPPVLPVTDAIAVSRHVDGVLVVVQSGRATGQALQEALADLDRVAAPVLGVVLNRAKKRGAGHGGYKYGYGYGYGAADAAEAVPPVLATTDGGLAEESIVSVDDELA